MLVHKKVIIDNIEYERYEINKVEWTFKKNLVGVVVIYYDDENKSGSLIRTHYFKGKEEINVNELIEQVIRIHDGL